MQRVLGARWPFKISNKALYEKCGAEPLGLAIRRFRCNLFGHVLRLSFDSPAHADGDGLQYCNTKEDIQKVEVALLLLFRPVLLFNEYHHFKCFKKSELMQIKENVDVQAKRSNGSTRACRKLAADRDAYGLLLQRNSVGLWKIIGKAMINANRLMQLIEN